MSYLFTAPYTLPKPRPNGPFLRKYGRVVEKLTAPAPIIAALPPPPPPPPPEPEPQPEPEAPKAPVYRHPVLIIASEVAAETGVTVDDIRGQRRMRPIALARQEVCYRAVRDTKLSLPQIGVMLGGRDHTTILHGANAHAKRHGLAPVQPYYARMRALAAAGGEGAA